MSVEKKLDEILDRLKTLELIEKDVASMATVLADLKGDVTGHNTRLTDLENAAGSMEHDIEDLKAATTGNKGQLEGVRQKVFQIDGLRSRNKQLARHLTELETYSRRENLILEGVPEVKDENTWSQAKNVLKDHLKLAEVDNIRIQRCDRLKRMFTANSKPRPIIIRFHWYEDRMRVWAARRNLKDTGIFMKEDFPAVVEGRRAMVPLLRLAREKDNTAHLVADKLMYKGRLHTCENIPVELLMGGEAGPSARIIDRYLFFSGRASPFSNFHYAPFTIEDETFVSNEQYYQYKRAIFAGRWDVAGAIMAEDEPYIMKQLGDSIHVDKSWYTEVGIKIMTQGLVAKFSQNKHLGIFVRKFIDYTFVECNSRDKWWSNGLSLFNSDLADPTQWKGQNYLGICINDAIKQVCRI